MKYLFYFILVLHYISPLTIYSSEQILQFNNNNEIGTNNSSITNILYNNTSNNDINSSNRTKHDQFMNKRATWVNVVICAVFILFILSTIIGNTLVILAVVIVKRLHRKDNYLIVSLAISDLLVGLLVMPFAMITEVTDEHK